MCHIERVDGNLVVIGSSGLIMQGCTIGPVRGDGGHKVHFAQSNTEKIVYATESTPNHGPPIRTSRTSRAGWRSRNAERGSAYWDARTA